MDNCVDKKQNQNTGLRYPTVLYRMNGNSSLVNQTALALDLLTTYQSTLAGTITADEHLGGLSPERGYASFHLSLFFNTISDSNGEVSSETCMSVEMMFSMGYLYHFYGVNAYADRAERVAFNSLPAALAPNCKFDILHMTISLQIPKLRLS